MLYCRIHFEVLNDELTITLMDIIIPIDPIILNIMVEPILHISTFIIIGFYYTRGENDPALGNFLYYSCWINI